MKACSYRAQHILRRVLVAAVALCIVAQAGAGVCIERLTVEGREAPVGLDVSVPRFGWQIVSSERNVLQTAYRIIVASSRERADSLDGDVWDSGWVRSDSSQWVALKSAPLSPNRVYHWRVQVKTNRGDSGWSEPSSWSTGLMSLANWRGSWIGLDSLLPGDRAERHSRMAVRRLRKEFDLGAGKVCRATIHISGLGNYTLYINGSRVGHDVLTPVPTDYTKTVAYDTYDVTPLLSAHNAIGVELAPGHYFAQTQNYQTNVRTTYGYPKLRANLIVEYEGGRADTIATDATWKFSADGPIRYANEYDGELYDARREQAGWASAGFCDSSWASASVVGEPGGVLRGNITPPMSVYSVEHPVAVRSYGRRHIIDFGTNNAGRVRLTLSPQAGDTVRIRHAELLAGGDSTLYVANLRSAEATAWYVGDGRQRRWSPEFTYYGFRYVEITGIDDIASCDIVRELIADRMDDGAAFAAYEAGGESLLNAIVANARRGVRSNYKGMPVDCPQRDERMPWLGDRTMGCLGESYLMDNHALYSKWMGDIRDGQRADGRISDVTPAYWRLYNTNITWPACLPFACEMLYRQYGDLRPMRESYAAIKCFLDMVRRDNYKDGLVPYDRYGDWCVPPESPKLVHSKDPARKTDGRLISSAYYYYLNRMMQRYAAQFGFAADAGRFAREAEVTLKAVNDTFFVGGRYSNGTVTANLLPLAMGMVPAGAAKGVADSLIHTIAVKNSMHLSAGVIGIQWLMRQLSAMGRGDVAYDLATADTYPGWGYMVRRGATTIWELWNGDTADPSMNSGNHVMLLGDLLPWCYEHLAGIRPDMSAPGFKRIVLKPDFSIRKLTGVAASHRSPYGIISSEWRRDGGKVTWRVSIPANTTAEVHLPDGSVREIGSGEWSFGN